MKISSVTECLGRWGISIILLYCMNTILIDRNIPYSKGLAFLGIFVIFWIISPMIKEVENRYW